MSSAISLDDFAPFRYQLSSRVITTVIGLNQLVIGDVRRVNVKIFVIGAFAVTDPNWWIGGFGGTTFRIPQSAHSSLELNWYDDNLFVTLPIFFNDTAGGNTIAVSEIIQIPSIGERTTAAKLRLASVYTKVQSAAKHGRLFMGSCNANPNARQYTPAVANHSRKW